MSELPQLQEVFDRLRRGWHLSPDDEPAFSAVAMQPDAYGIFLVHYPIVLWLQYWLFNFDIPAVAKALIAFVLTTALSWAVTRALRHIPGARSVL